MASSHCHAQPGLFPPSILVRKLGVLHTTNPDHARAFQAALETLATHFSPELDVEAADVVRVIGLSDDEVPEFAGKVQKHALAFLASLFAHDPERQPEIAAVFASHDLFAHLIKNFAKPFWIEALTCHARTSAARRDHALGLSIMHSLIATIAQDPHSVQDAYREIGRLAEVLSSFPCANAENCVTLAGLIVAITTVDRPDIEAETIFLEAYGRFLGVAPESPAVLASTLVIPALVASADRYSRDFSAAQGHFLCVAAQDRDLAEFMLAQNVWKLLFAMLTSRFKEGKVGAAHAALSLAELAPDTFVSQEVGGKPLFEELSRLGDGFPFAVRSVVSATMMVAVRDASDEGFLTMWESDACVHFIIESLVADDDELVDLRLQAVLRIFGACAVAEERLGRLQDMVGDAEDFIAWLPEIAANERVPPALAMQVQSFSALFVGEE
jgi:hypothetical protein